MVETSLILRTKNEEKWVGECLKRIFEQTYKNFEVVVVDSGSTDKTLEVVKKFPIRLYQIKPEEFTYPYALNFGCREANATKYFVILSAHSLPISSTWIEDGLKNFTSEKIMGVYGFVWALPDASVWEKLFFNKYLCKILGRSYKKEMTENQMGLMGFTGAIIRRDLWEKYNFPQEYALGGEDGAWARHWLERNYVAIRDYNFSVYHSHGLGLIDLWRQLKYWKSIGTPRAFQELEHRNSQKGRKRDNRGS